MSYIVTHGTIPVGIDSGKNRPFGLHQALAHACFLLSEDRLNVTIQDGAGHSISGADLIACCNGDKTLTADLRAT